MIGCRSGGGDAPVTVFAASSLREVVTEIASEWSRRTGRPIRTRFEATSLLVRQIQEGAKADLIITAAPEWLDRVRARERKDWLSNRLVCVVSRDAPAFDLAAADSLALANEHVPAGRYAREALGHQGVDIPERTIYGSSARDVLSKVSQGGARAGIVYATDAAIDPQVKIAFIFPPESHSEIRYSVGLLTPRAKDFYDALGEPWAGRIARTHGFLEPEEP